MAKAPFQNGKNGGPDRDGRGRFAKGNNAAVGHGGGIGRKVQRLRVALLEAVTVEDIKTIVMALVGKASKGDIVAARTLFGYVLGRPVEHDVFDRLAALEELAAEIRVPIGAHRPFSGNSI